jgi:hypothetical protein
MTKKKEQVKSGVIYISAGTTLASIIADAINVGATDFSKVRFDHTYISNGCNCAPGDYCYCESGYNDERFSWEI